MPVLSLEKFNKKAYLQAVPTTCVAFVHYVVGMSVFYS